MVKCPHCGDEHPDEARYCSTSGKPIAPAVATERVRPLDAEKGAYELLKQAAELYRAHARTFLVTAAVLFVPGAVLNSCAVNAILGPALVAAPAQVIAQRGQELGQDPMRASGLAVGGFTLLLLGLVTWSVTALLLYGVVVPLTQGAVTIAAADRILGGDADWRQHWWMLRRRLGVLLSALIPAGVMMFVGYFFVVPGIILSFLFMFITPVALIEGRGGLDACKRSFELVRSDWLRSAVMLIVFIVLSTIAHWTANAFVPRGALFVSNLVGDLLLLVILPIPLIGGLLLYFDLRRKLDGLDDDRLKAELETLRPPV